jgi:23S rRNA pseudouridine1911/1915/1917 synthase
MAKYSVATSSTGLRLDHWLAQTIPGPSRSRWQALIRAGNVLVDGQTTKPSYELRGKELIEYEIPPAEPVNIIAEEIPLDIVYEDGDIIAINKQPGLVVHPAPGHATGTLVHALLHHCQDLQGVGGRLRPGIVHRIDKDTSGVLVAAKHDAALRSLQDQFKQRTVRKEYQAIVHGVPSPPSGTIDTMIGRHPVHRKKMSARPIGGKQAISHYEVVTKLRGASLVRVRIETGRTHQIRLQMSHIGNPVVGDTLYGGGKGTLGARVRRQMLHALRIELQHPSSAEQLCLSAPLPDDMQTLIRDISH